MSRLIKKDSGEGIVCAISKGEVIIAPIAEAQDANTAKPGKKCAAAGCGSCGGCAPLISADGGYVGRLRVRVEDPQKYKPGDRVTYNRFVPEPNLISALAFGVPVVFAVTVMLCWFVNAPQSVESTMAILSIIAAFFCGLIVLGVVDAIFKKKYPPSITGVNAETRGFNPLPTSTTGVNTGMRGFTLPDAEKSSSATINTRDNGGGRP